MGTSNTSKTKVGVVPTLHDTIEEGAMALVLVVVVAVVLIVGSLMLPSMKLSYASRDYRLISNTRYK